MALLVITHNILHHLETRKSVKQLNLCHKILFSSFFFAAWIAKYSGDYLRCEMKDVRENLVWESWKGRGWEDNWDILLWSGIFSHSQGTRDTFLAVILPMRALSVILTPDSSLCISLQIILMLSFPTGLGCYLVWRKYQDKIQFILYQAKIGLKLWSKLIHVIYWNIS